MKRILTFMLMLATGIGMAQPRKQGMPDMKKALQAAKLDLSADKLALELGEVTTLNVTLDTYDADGNWERFDYRPENPAKAPWKVTGWKIVEGGGELRPTSENGNTYAAILTAPQTMPANKCVIIEATMVPLSNKYAQSILRRVIYIKDNQNVFYFNSPAIGINNEKYTVNNNGGNGGKMTDLQKKIEELKKMVPANQRGRIPQTNVADANKMSAPGFDLNALTSNTRAVFVPSEGTTTITISGNKVAMVNGTSVENKRNFMLNISFPGRGAGAFKIKENKKVTAAITFPMMGLGCGCYDSPEDKAEREKAGEPGPTCMGGIIRITKYDMEKKVVEGIITANFEGVHQRKIFYGDISGKFSAVLAN